MHALVFEPDHTGHRFAYVGPMLPAIREHVDRLTVVTTEAARGSPEFKEHIHPHAARIEVDFRPVIDTTSPMAAARGKLALLRDSVARHKPDHLYSPSADGMAQLLGAAPLTGFPRGTESEACMHRGGWAYPCDTLKRKLAMRAGLAAVTNSPFTLVHHVDVVSYEWITRRGGSLARRSRLLADPVDAAAPISKALARRTLGLPEGGRYLGCAGVLDERKGIDLLVSAFARARLSSTDHLLLAGRLSSGVKQLIHTQHADLVAAGRILLIDRYVNKDELHAALGAMDLVVTPYPAHVGLSNIAIRAAAAHRPILAADFGWLGLIVPRFGLGVTTRVRDAEGFTRAIEQRLDVAHDYRFPAAGERLLAFHSHPNFVACWTARLRERLGKPVSPDLRTWQWVMEGVKS